MNKKYSETASVVAHLLRQRLEHGSKVRIDGLGTFFPAKVAGKGFRFIPQSAPRVFIAYVEEDLAFARKLYQGFSAAGFDPWIDKKKLVPGQNWPRAIENAIRSADFFIACFSRRSVSKRGCFHSELRFALECARRVPLDEIFLVPVRLDDCTLPARITRKTQYVDLFPDWDEGFQLVVDALRQQHELRKRKQLPLAS